MREHRDFNLDLLKYAFQLILKIQRLLPGKSQIIIAPHILPVPQRLEHLPLLTDA